ncbi:MAG: hypothetical protein WD895_10320 [Acidimicrobiia bacterium]
MARPLLLGLFIAAPVAVLALQLLEPELEFDVTVVLFSVPFLAVGCLVLVRAGWHRMGWLLVTTGLFLTVALAGFTRGSS